MTEKYDWLEKKTPRSIDQLRLWNENPRLNPEEKHITLADFTDDFITDDNEKTFPTCTVEIISSSINYGKS